jgi:solute carrier family 6 amino acid/orphan transporter-like 15/16/17/18/20
MNKLLTIEIWRDAATQVFFSLGVGFGTILMYSCHNNTNFKCKTAALYYGVIDTAVGICSCIIVFSLRGFQAHFKDRECLKELEERLNETLLEDYHLCNNTFLSQPVCKSSLIKVLLVNLQIFPKY